MRLELLKYTKGKDKKTESGAKKVVISVQFYLDQYQIQ